MDRRLPTLFQNKRGLRSKKKKRKKAQRNHTYLHYSKNLQLNSSEQECNLNQRRFSEKNQNGLRKNKSTVGQILIVQLIIEDVRAINLQSILLLTAKERVKNDSFCSEKDRYDAHIQRVTVIVLVATKNKQLFKILQSGIM